MKLSAPDIIKQAQEFLETEALSEEKIELLRTVIESLDKAYYIDNNNLVSDYEYDQLFKKLVALEEKNPQLITEQSPTQRVAKGLGQQFENVDHLIPMLSLDNTYNAEDLRDWDKRCKNLAGTDTLTYCVEPKYDGASISLVYENNRFLRAITRGDGVTGENVSTNIKQIKSLPLVLRTDEKINQLEVRGEVVFNKKIFAQLNEQRIDAGLAPLANPRNAASGTLRILDPQEAAKRKLNLVLYHIGETHFEDIPPYETHRQSLEWLNTLGMPTPIKLVETFNSIDEVIHFCIEFESKRDHLDYEIDGLVIKVNQLQLQEKMGMTSHHPRWAVAYKFKARQAMSQLERVEFQVGRTGSVTPVAKITPVHIGGVTVSSISLFNADIIREKDLKIGDTVIVERAGDVIPYIVGPEFSRRRGHETEILFPTHCPACQSTLEKPEDEAVWRCLNINCPAQVVERLIHFCSKDAMDIRGLGDTLLRKFFDKKILIDLPGIYKINWDLFQNMEGFGEKSVEKLKQAIEKSKQQPLHRLIFGLGIRHVGETMAKTLAKSVSHLKELSAKTEEQLLQLEDVGPKVVQSIQHFFVQETNQHLLDELENLGINLMNTQRNEQSQQGEWKDKTFLFTGTLTHFKRSQAEEMVENKGGKILGSVSSKLNYLVVGKEAGSKLEKAKKLTQIQILSEEEFLEMLNS